jgi:hypothetical protein
MVAEQKRDAPDVARDLVERQTHCIGIDRQNVLRCDGRRSNQMQKLCVKRY